LKPEGAEALMPKGNLLPKCWPMPKLLLEGNSQPENEKKGGELLLRSHHGLPKNKALIKFLSEPGMKALMQKTENFYMQEQSKHMHIIDDELFFVIEEKNNSIELTDKGIDLITKVYHDPNFYILPDMGRQWPILKNWTCTRQGKN
jgi:preprotein translocase subunit SecA